MILLFHKYYVIFLLHYFNKNKKLKYGFVVYLQKQ